MQITNPVLYEIWKDRYCKNDETIDDNIRRVAKYCAQTPQEEQDFYDVMDLGLFFPAGRTMSNAGVGKDLTLNNCFVAPQIKDDLTDIFNKVSLGACTHQKGGGIGYDFSQLRPKGSPTSNDAIASGAVSFMDVFNAQTATILQGNRRGANMGVMSVYAMDIEDFINAKSQDANRLVHFNVTVMIDDDFMIAKNKNEDIWLHYPVYDEDGRLLKDETKWKFKKKVNAQYIWDQIITQAYNNGEPGIFFYDNMNKDNNLWYVENIVCSNPCAEFLSGTLYGNNPVTNEKLKPEEYGGACNLGSLILHNFVVDPFTKDAHIDLEKLKLAISIGLRFLDNIIDINKFPNQIYENYQKALRATGLGVTSLGDTLAMLNIKYNSQEALDFTDEIMEFIAINAYKTSIELAKEKGSFPFLDREKFINSGYLQKHLLHNDLEWVDIINDIEQYGIRNSKILSIAPTGTMSLTFGSNCSSGIEPIFSLSYDRKVKMGGQDDSDIQIVKMEDYAYKAWKETLKDNIVNEDIFVTAMNLSVDDHIKMLEKIAYHTDMSCSKTINIPTDYSFEDTKKIYDKCWEAGIKGCTIFRPNAIRQGILISENTEETVLDNDLHWGTTVKASDELVGRKRKIMSGCGSLHLQAWYDPRTGKLMEMFLSKGSNGGCNSFMTGLSRTVSLALRTGASFDYAIDQLQSVPACPSYVARSATKKDCSKGNSCPSAIAHSLIEIQKEIDCQLGMNELSHCGSHPVKFKLEDDNLLNSEEREYLIKNGEIAFSKKYHKCPQCSDKLENVDGCLQCMSCGFSKCG